MARVKFTATRVAEFDCPTDKAQAFLWDADAPGLALRATAGGAKAYIFQARLPSGQSVRVTIGKPLDSNMRGAWSIPKAQAEARRLQVMVDQGQDPRIVKAAQVADHDAKRTADRTLRQRAEVTGLSAWEIYCAERKPHWSDRNHADHIAFAREGGANRKRAAGKKVQPGPLRSLLQLPLSTINAESVQTWVARESKSRPARAALGFRLLRAFINWCSEHANYRELVDANACRGKRTREKLSKAKARTDSLQREQLAAWFTEVRRDPNLVASAYLQGLLLTGARREELAGLQWTDVDFQWSALRIRDKVDGERTIPLTPYLKHLISSLPKRAGNPHVFSSVTSKSGAIQDARGNHTRALKRAGLPHVSLHGLRRSFGTLAEWVEVPVGIVAQIQGHKPSAIAEKHYRVRPIDLLRLWHARIEVWILGQAQIQFATKGEEKSSLRVVAAG